MSTSPRGNRSRLKQSSSSSPIPIPEEAVDLQLPHTLDSTINLLEPAKGGQLQALSPNNYKQRSIAGDTYAENLNTNMNNHTSTTMTTVEPGLHALSSVATAALSDGGSSSLSELEYTGEDNEDQARRSVENNSSEESDSEAETERLGVSPQELRTMSGTTIVQKSTNGDTPAKLTSLRIISGASQATVGGETPSRILSSPGQISLISAGGQSNNGHIRSPLDLAGHKRKRSGSLSDASSMSLSDEDRLSKRSDSDLGKDPVTEVLNAPLLGEIAVADDDGSDSLSEVSSQSDLTATVEDMLLVPQDDLLLEPPEVLKDDLSEYGSDEPASDHEMIDVVEGLEDAVVKPEEVDEIAELDVEDDEGEAALKSEDELAKKKSAMEALLPIEKLFAIFRDQLFEERIAVHAQELELLNDPNTTHPEYLAMRQCLDQRRDEKIHLEQVGLFYKLKCIETTVLAARAQLHSQYYQDVRAIRECNLEKMNEVFCKIQRERRQIQNREPQFGYVFQTKRSKQISQQAAYNKEVSVLSGIARYVGFPGAPEMQGARSAEIDEDFRAMQIKPLASTKSYPSQLPSARATEAPVEESFLERNPWANPNHPSHQQPMPTLDRAPSNLGSRVAISTPTLSKRASHNNNNNSWLGSDIQNSASSNPPHSEPPSANGPPHPPPTTQRPVSNGSSPFDHHPAVRRENSNRDRENIRNPNIASSAPSTRPASRFERPYRPKNMPPATFPLSPPGGMHTPLQRGTSNPGFLGNGAGVAGLTGIGKEDGGVGRYASPARFGPLGGGASGSGGGGPRPMGVVEGLGLR